MAVPKKRKSFSRKRRNSKRGCDISFDNFTVCNKCKKPFRSHSICACRV